MRNADPPLPSNPAVPSSGTAGIDIPDANLRRIVEAALGKAEGASISPDEMATLTELDVGASSWINSEGWYSLDVGDLTGLEAAVNLERLYLPSEAEVENLTPLAGLTNLKVLSVGGSYVEDISPLSNLANLEVLNLVDSYVEDIAALAGLDNLVTLNLGYTDVTDLSPLAGLANLKAVDVSLPTGIGNYPVDVRDFSWLADLTGLEELTAPRSDVTPWVAGLSSLRKLDAVLTDFAALSHLTDLQVLKTDAGGIDLSPLSALTGLRVVGLYGGASGDLAPLSALSSLVEIDLSPERFWFHHYVGQIEDVSALSGLTQLAKVWLGNNRIRDLAPLVANPGLGGGDLVYVPRNPLTDESINQHVATLRNRGVIVHFRPTVQ